MHRLSVTVANATEQSHVYGISITHRCVDNSRPSRITRGMSLLRVIRTTLALGERKVLYNIMLGACQKV